MHLKKRVMRHVKAISRHTKDHFIPHRGNNHHPHVLKHHVLFGYSLILIFLKTLAIAGTIALPSSSLQASPLTAQNIVSLTNATRVNIGAPSLTVNNKLTRAAQAKAEDMLKQQYFAHTSPAGVSPWYWIKHEGYDYRYSAENLAVHFTNAEDVQGGWMTSPSHRANIVNSKYTDIGVGIATGMFEGFQSTFVVQMFGRQQNSAIAKTTSFQTESSEAENVLPAINAKVTPSANSYRVELTAAEASTIYVQMAGRTTSLNRSPGTNDWSGNLPNINNTNSSDGDPVYVVAIQEDGSVISENIASLAPNSTPDRIFEFNADTHREVKFFGWLTVKNLTDTISRIYVLFLVFLASCLLISLVIKFNKQKMSVTAHAMLVIGLGLFMYLA